MDASTWIAVAGLAFVILVQLAVTAFVMGGLFQRVKDLEKNAPDVAALIRGLAKLEAAVEHLTKQFDQSLGWLEKVEGFEPHQQQRPPRSRP